MRDSWFNGLFAMEDTLVLERYVNEELLKIHSGHDDDAHVRPLFSLVETSFFSSFYNYSLVEMRFYYYLHWSK